MKRKPTLLPFGLAVLAVGASTAGTLYYQSRHVPKGGPGAALSVSPTPVPGTLLAEPPPAAPEDATLSHPVIYRVVSDENGVRLAKVAASMGTSDDAQEPLAQQILNQMADEEASPLPKGTRVLSYKLSRDGALATVDLNGAFVSNFSGGDTAEALTLESILATIGQFGPRAVQITVEGKKIDSLGGTQSLTVPLPVPQNASQPQPQMAQGGPTP